MGRVTGEEAALSVPHTLTLAHTRSAVPVHPFALTSLPSGHVASPTYPGLVVKRCQAETKAMFREEYTKK